jgi:ankyrin repeat protein
MPTFPLELLLEIAHHIRDCNGELRHKDFNAFLQVNCALYDCLNPILWKSAIGRPVITAQVLTHLIRNNNLALLQHFLQLGADIETVLPSFNTSDGELRRPSPLVVAAYLDNVPLARLLSENGAKVRYDQPSYSALHAARTAEMVQLLLEHRAYPGWQGRHRTPLHWYLMRDNIAAMRVVLPRGIDVDPLDQQRRTPLYAARSTDAVMLLLEFGANVDKRDVEGNTPLHLAARMGSPDMVRLLVEHWPDDKIPTNKRHNTPLHEAIVAGKAEVVRILLTRWPEGATMEDGHCDIPLHLAARYGNIDVVRLLVVCWPDGTRKKGRYGNRPLHCAAVAGKMDAIRLLVESWPGGLWAENRHRSTPLEMAAARGMSEVVTLLQEYLLA